MTDHTYTEPSTATLPADPRGLWDRATATATSVIDALQPGELADPTPCTEFDVAGLLGHLAFVVDRVAAMARGEDPMAAPEPEPVTDLQTFVERWRKAVADCHDAWSDDASLAVPVVLPWVQGTGAEALAGYLSELTVHTWDLARATGQTPVWDPDVVAVSFAAIRSVLPAEGRHERFEAARAAMPPGAGTFADPFGPAVEVAPDAPAIDRLVAYNGRRP